MKFSLALYFFAIACLYGCTTKPENKSEPSAPPTAEVPADTVKKSVPKQIEDKLEDATIKISYHAPAVRGRTIWGGLVPYGEVWVTGAHKATALEIDKPFIFGTKKIDAGKYALFTIPTENNWTVILNKNWEQHLTDEYDAKDDLARVTVPSENDLPLQERLYYDVRDYGGSKGAIFIRWEKVSVAVPIEIK